MQTSFTTKPHCQSTGSISHQAVVAAAAAATAAAAAAAAANKAVFTRNRIHKCAQFLAVLFCFNAGFVCTNG